VKLSFVSIQQPRKFGGVASAMVAGMLAACSGAPPTASTWMHATGVTGRSDITVQLHRDVAPEKAPKEGSLYVVDVGYINVYDAKAKNPPVQRSIPDVGDTIAACVDSSGNLYVAGWHFVSEFAPGQSEPFFTLSLRNIIVGCAVDSSKNLYLAEDGDGSGSGDWDVLELAPQSPFVIRALEWPLSEPSSMALDKRGNLYVSDIGHNPGEIYVYAPGKTTPHRSFGVSGLTSLAIDNKGILYAQTNLSSNSIPTTAVNEFRPGQSTPFQIVSGLTYGQNIAVSSAGRLYVDQNASPPVITEFGPRQTKPLLAHVTKGLTHPLGIAVYDQ
jgi:hypothetical protein